MSALMGKSKKNTWMFCSSEHICPKCRWKAKGREFCKVFMQPIISNQYQCSSFEKAI